MSAVIHEMLAAATSSPHGLSWGAVSGPSRLSWNEVHHLAMRMARGLAANGIGRHCAVAVLAVDAADVAPLAQAIWLRGAAVTMLQQPTPRSDPVVWLADTVRAIQLIGADLVVLGEPFWSVLEQLAGCRLAVCTVESLRAAAPLDPSEVTQAAEADVALRQLTSGSTGRPKAVEISHANLAANSRALRDGFGLDADNDVLASWLPLSHDMGMIAFLQFPMQVGVEAVVVAADEFLRRPSSWAEVISRHRATITAGPNFAYAVLARFLQRADPGEIDLSSLRIAVNGAEPIDHRDLVNFVAVGARFGLPPHAPTPAYGLAEATLAVSMATLRDPATVDSVNRAGIRAAHRAQAVPDDSDTAAHVVCVGAPVTGMQVRIARNGRAVRPREIGTIELRGPAVAERYLTSAGPAPLAGRDGWFDTGDLGYLDELGRLYVCGRTKDLIVVAGTNLHPHDIERAAETVRGVRKGCVIALRIEAGEGTQKQREGFVVLAEVRDIDAADDGLRISREIKARVTRQIGYAPREVRLFPAGTLPKTASGKLRRSSARDLLSTRPHPDRHASVEKSMRR